LIKKAFISKGKFNRKSENRDEKQGKFRHNDLSCDF